MHNQNHFAWILEVLITETLLSLVTTIKNKTCAVGSFVRGLMKLYDKQQLYILELQYILPTYTCLPMFGKHIISPFYAWKTNTIVLNYSKHHFLLILHITSLKMAHKYGSLGEQTCLANIGRRRYFFQSLFSLQNISPPPPYASGFWRVFQVVFVSQIQIFHNFLFHFDGS